MSAPCRSVRVMATLVAVLAVCPPPLVADSRHGRYEGRRLADALKVLQTRGLRIVFSSEIVTADMRVASEPRAETARQILDELLTPHGLTANEGPGHVLQVVRAKRRLPPSPIPRAAAQSSRAAPEPHRETVSVTAPEAPYEPDAVSSVRLPQSRMRAMAGALADDPLRAAQALPGAATGDDFRSEFSVRGSAYRHVGVVVDGVTTNWLRHAAYGRGDTGSVAMISSEGLDHATLQAGTYAQRNGGHLGAELDLTLREGSREATLFRSAVTTAHATLVGEGPIGRSRRGSWLATVRNSHLDWPVRAAGVRTGTVLGFTDLQSKFVYDVSAEQQVNVSLLTGRSSVDELDEQYRLGDGSNRVTLATLGWRSTVGSRTVISQRVSVVTHTFSNQTPAEQQAAGRGASSAFAYRADVARAWTSGILDAGGQVQQVQRRGDLFRDTTWLRSVYANVTWTPASWLTVAPGLRIADSTGASRPALSPWILTEWALRPTWMLRASTGRSHQFPGTELTARDSIARQLEPERATHVDVGIAHRLTSSMRWQATWFARREHDVMREPDDTAWLVSTTTADPASARSRVD